MAGAAAPAHVGVRVISAVSTPLRSRSALHRCDPSGVLQRYERKLWMRDLVMGVAYPPVDH
jgi:hypothetical protein